jgi:hypothetical protein
MLRFESYFVINNVSPRASQLPVGLPYHVTMFAAAKTGAGLLSRVTRCIWSANHSYVKE